MVAANAILTFSCWFYYNNVLLNSGIAVEKPLIHYILIALFGGLTLVSIKKLLMPPAEAEEGG
ncbi:hypothetical protein ABTD32_19745, partial [Acinetobacter baumannii]